MKGVMPPADRPIDTSVQLPHVDWRAAPSGTQRRLAGFLDVLDVDAADVPAHPDALPRLRRGELQAVVVHGVYGADTLATLVRRLQQHDPPFLRSSFPAPFHAGFYGRNLNLCADLAGYFREAAAFNTHLQELGPPTAPLHRRVGELLAALDGGRPLLAAPGPQPGQHYMFTTLRHHDRGGYIPPHFDNEVMLRPSYVHLAQTVQAHIVSFVLALTQAQRGGALEVFDHHCAPHEAVLINDDRARAASARPDTAGLASVRFSLPPGCLIVLDSGRWLHRLSPVEGDISRWSACSFIACSRDDRVQLAWG